MVEPGQLDAGSALQTRWRPDIRLFTDENGGIDVAIAGDLADTAVAHPDLRLLLSTSGSTGDPKLVRLSGNNIASNSGVIAEYLAITPADRAMSTLPLFYSKACRC